MRCPASTPLTGPLATPPAGGLRRGAVLAIVLSEPWRRVGPEATHERGQCAAPALLGRTPDGRIAEIGGREALAERVDVPSRLCDRPSAQAAVRLEAFESRVQHLE